MAVVIGLTEKNEIIEYIHFSLEDAAQFERSHFGRDFVEAVEMTAAKDGDFKFVQRRWLIGESSKLEKLIESSDEYKKNYSAIQDNF